MLFYVSDHDAFEAPEQQRQLLEQLENLHIQQRRKRDVVARPELGVVYESEDGRNVIREHVIRARL